MDAEKKQEFTRRISQSNRSELVVIQYEILDTYLADAQTAHEEGDYEAFAGGKQTVYLRNCQEY